MSAAAWGAGDFGGGLTSRRAPVFGVVLISQVVGMAMALAIAVASHESFPEPTDLAWAVAAGLAGGTGIVSLYRALAIGRMAVVAPVTAVLSATIPVVVGFIFDAVPPPVVVVGMGARHRGGAPRVPGPG